MLIMKILALAETEYILVVSVIIQLHLQIDHFIPSFPVYSNAHISYVKPSRQSVLGAFSEASSFPNTSFTVGSEQWISKVSTS